MKKSVAITILTLTTLLYIVASCTSRDARLGKLDSIDSLMEQNPQAAYDSLCHDKEQMTENSPQNVTMRYRLLEAKAQNKLYLQMPSDSAFQDVVDYYDTNGTSNDKMQAYYLQGCIYRDQKEAPKAIHHYKKAVEFADTLNNSCDFLTLYRIYGQMADIFTHQNLLSAAMASELDYAKYTWKAKDTANFMLGKEKMAALYCSMNKEEKAISQVKECISLYRKYGMLEDAAGAYPLLIDILVHKHQYEEAHRYMKIFEKESGLFDKNGDISKERQYYYHVKGQYFLGVNRPDSAKACFLKMDESKYPYEVNHGLMAVCRLQRDWEKVGLYAEKSEMAMDSILKANEANAVLQASQMYDFQRMNEQMFEQTLAKEHLQKELLAMLTILLIVVSIAIYMFRKFRKKIRNQQTNLVQSHDLLRQRESEIESWNDRFLLISNELERYKEDFRRMSSTEKNVIVDDNEIYQRFKKKGLGVRMDKFPTEIAWKKLIKMMGEYFPLFSDLVINPKRRNKLSASELRVAILTRLQFTNSEIANVMDTSPASISNAKGAVNKKLFGESGASSLFQNMLNV